MRTAPMSSQKPLLELSIAGNMAGKPAADTRCFQMAGNCQSEILKGRLINVPKWLEHNHINNLVVAWP